MARIFKEEGKLEIWKQKTNGRYDMIASYDICKWSGKLGPKFTEGDRQAPEGFYTVRPAPDEPATPATISPSTSAIPTPMTAPTAAPART